MINLYDIAYTAVLAIGAPYWLLRSRTRTKVLRALRERMGRIEDTGQRDLARPAIMIHAVSLGEINATRGLVNQLAAARPELQFIVSTTTDTGYDRGLELYGKIPAVTLIRYPLDFTRAIRRCLDRLRPELVVLMELEVWPNFIKQCAKCNVPVVLVNGRMTESAYRNYRRFGLLTKSMFRRLTVACVQDTLYAARFAAAGVPADRILMTGTMKFDTAAIADHVQGADELAAAVGIGRSDQKVWVCGSTGPGEEELVLRQYRALLASHARLRLVIVPRHPERFNEVAELIARQGFALVRRSRPGEMPPADGVIPPVILGDTMGELRKFYSLADVVFVGRTLVDMGPRQHGSDMIEPAALGKAVIVGPFTTNFADAMERFREAEAILEATSEAALGQGVSVLLSSPRQALAIGQRAQEIVHEHQGATMRHTQVILEHLGQKHG